MRRGLFGWLLVIAACGTPTASIEEQIVVTMVRQAVGPNEVVAVTLENRGDEPIDNPCAGLYLERREPSGWQLAVGPACIQPVPPPHVTLQPGQSRTVSFERPAGGARYRPVAQYRFDGEYYYRLAIGPSAEW